MAEIYLFNEVNLSVPSKAHARSAKMQKAPVGAFLILAEKAGWPLRGAEGDSVAARLEQGSHPQPHSARKTKGPVKGPLIFLAVDAAPGGGCSDSVLPIFLITGKFTGI